MTPGPNDCTCGHNGDCNCPFVPSVPAEQLAAVKPKREKVDYRAVARELYDTLRRIARGYMKPEQLRRAIERPRDPHYGLGYEEVLEMVLDNIQAEADAAVSARRRP